MFPFDRNARLASWNRVLEEAGRTQIKTHTAFDFRTVRRDLLQKLPDLKKWHCGGGKPSAGAIHWLGNDVVAV